MKTFLKILIGLGVLTGGIIFLFMGKYNTLVLKEETANEAWSQVENVYQRRSDLIPNLVATVKGYAEHEEETLTAVVEARANATKTNINIKDINEIASFQQQQSGLTSALSRLMVVVEKYPELKANENFLELQTALEGSENRIAVERKRFNTTVKEYNVYRRQFPNSLVAWIFKFEKLSLFEAEKGSEIAPLVEF
jgi:LemA protein